MVFQRMGALAPGFGLMIFVLASKMMGVADGQPYGTLDFSPRFMFSGEDGGSGLLGGRSGPTIARRDDSFVACGVGYHSCLEVQNASSSCCRNDQYCYFSPANAISCCQIGSDCDNVCASSPFSSFINAGPSAIAVNQTLTTTITTISSTITTTLTTAACSPRACTAASAFLCASDLCCSYGSTCGNGAGSCVSTPDYNAASTGACATGQFSCPGPEGGGCCAVGAKCTAADETLLCVATITATGSGSLTTTTSSAVRTGPSGIFDANFTSSSNSTHPSSLSGGAKAGIGVGVALGVILALLGIIWFTRFRRLAAREKAANAVRDDPMAESSAAGGGGVLSSPRSKLGNGKRGGGGGDYFGPDPQAGPFTIIDKENEGGVEVIGVPLTPYGPRDVAAPVEIGGGSRVVPEMGDEIGAVPEKPEFRIELP